MCGSRDWKAEVGFEPTNDGFAIRSLSPLGYSAESEKDTRQPSLRRGQGDVSVLG